ASTDRLHGRKMFNWGTDPGGRRWQEFLAQPGLAYIEIQGGLAQTQGEYVAMPPGAQWSWLEAYGAIEAGPAKVHGKDWTDAHQAIERELERRLPRASMEAELARYAAQLMDCAPVELLHHGSAWAARDLGVLTRGEGDLHAAAELWLAAAQTAPAVAPLAIECAKSLLQASRSADAIAFIDSLPPPLRAHGRIRLLRAMAALEQ